MKPTPRRPKLIRLSIHRAPEGLWAIKFSFGLWVVASGVYDSRRLAVERAEALYFDVRLAVEQFKEEQAHYAPYFSGLTD